MVSELGLFGAFQINFGTRSSPTIPVFPAVIYGESIFYFNFNTFLFEFVPPMTAAIMVAAAWLQLEEVGGRKGQTTL